MADAAEVAIEVISALGRAGIPSALGGALALNWWSEPRGTVDADINVFVEPAGYGQVVDTLEALGANLDRAECLQRFAAGDVAVARMRGVRVDLFAPSIPFHAVAAETVVSAEIGGQRVPVLSAEALAVFKLLFFRPKDLLDLRTLVRRRASELDSKWVRTHVAEMMGSDDERVVEWDTICEESGM